MKRLLRLLPQRHRSKTISGTAVRSSSRRAFEDAHLRRIDAGRAARGAVSGAIHVADEIGVEASSFVKDAVVGVLQGARDVAKTTTVVFGDLAVGTRRGTPDPETEFAETERQTVEGAIESATSVGIDPQIAAEQATQGVVDAVQALRGDLPSAARATVSGVISGVSGAGGDVAGSSRAAARRLVSEAPETEEEVVDVARNILEGAIETGEQLGDLGAEAVYAVASETVQAAYERGQVAGDAVRDATFEIVTRTRRRLPRELELRLLEIGRLLSEDLSKDRGAWRGWAFWRAGVSLIDVGGLDLAASLAHFMLLSFFPLIALVVVVFSLFVAPETIQTQLSDTLDFFFPASREFLDEAIAHLFEARVTTGIVAVIGIILGSGGLFLATNRAVNRVFGCRPRRLVRRTIMQTLLTLIVVLLFLASIGLTVVFRVAISIGDVLPAVSETINGPLVSVIELVAAIVPLFMTFVVFVMVYYAVPNTAVNWRDATFGALVAVMLFETAKHLFFWLTNLANERSVLYGPLASVIILLIWSSIAGMIFLYGAALTHEAARQRPVVINNEFAEKV